jgi:transcriptional regulator with XRE-family HTH domain
MRKDANLSGRALASAVGWHFTKVSKLETGDRSPSENDIRAWCEACGAEDQVADLIATVRQVAVIHHEWRKQMQAGLKHMTESSVPLYEQTSLFRIYDTFAMPGLFTTAEYAAALFTWWQGFMGLKDDLDAAVQARMERQRVIYTGDRQFRVVIEEQVLRTRIGDADVMAGQLDRLMAVMSLPRVSIGVIPAGGIRHALTQGSFWMFDDTRVRVETVSESLNITQSRDIALYARVFELLHRSAVHGREARQLIGSALRDLGGEPG